MAKKTKISRRKPSLDPRPRFFIYSEGRNTEPSYFIQFARQVCRSLVRVEAPRDNDSAPITVCDKAIQKRKELDRELRRDKSKSFSHKDQVWAVFDKDTHDSFDAAVMKCKDNDISFAHSVPSFELWILLHFTYTSKPFSNCDELIREIGKHIEGYEKTENLAILEEIVSNYETATVNSERLCEENRKSADECANPSTYVHKLTVEMKCMADNS